LRRPAGCSFGSFRDTGSHGETPPPIPEWPWRVPKCGDGLPLMPEVQQIVVMRPPVGNNPSFAALEISGNKP